MKTSTLFIGGVIGLCTGGVIVGKLPNHETETPLAVGLKGKLNGNYIGILTKERVIECISGNGSIQIQEGNPIDGSYISPDFTQLNLGNGGITLTTERMSGDIIIRQNDRVIAVLRKDGDRKLDSFYGKYPDEKYCNKDYGSDGITLK